MPTTATEDLRLANRNLSIRFERLQSCENRAPSIQPADFSKLRNEILCAVNCMRSLPHDWDSDQQLQAEVSACRRNLQQIARLLPGFHVLLQAEKRRLQLALDHLDTTAAWAEASRKSL